MSARAEAFSMRIGLFEFRSLVFGMGCVLDEGTLDWSWDPSVGVVLPMNISWAGAMRGGFSWSSTLGLGGYLELAAITKGGDCVSWDIFARTKIYRGGWSCDFGLTFNLTRG